jgi:predicted TIM-barrel fold metal-dependent hydrolase
MSDVFYKFPELKVALSEGGIGWMPYLLERIDYSWGRHKYWCNINADKLPSELFREHIYGCFISDQSGIEQRHRIGIDNILFESDYPHSDSNWPHTASCLPSTSSMCPTMRPERSSSSMPARCTAFGTEATCDGRHDERE